MGYLNPSGHHHIDIDVGGESILANLLRKTIGAFNTSSSVDMQSSNKRRWPCLVFLWDIEKSKNSFHQLSPVCGVLILHILLFAIINKSVHTVLTVRLSS